MPASSTLNPASMSVCRPLSIPASPPSATNACNDLGLKSLPSCPGLYPNLLFSTWKSASVPGSGFKASSLTSNVRVDALLRPPIPPCDDEGRLRNDVADGDRACLVVVTGLCVISSSVDPESSEVLLSYDTVSRWKEPKETKPAHHLPGW